MKNKLLIGLLSVAFAFGNSAFAQSFSDDFESYNNGDYLANSSTKWRTWNNNPGTSEDVQVSNSDANSGSNSIYFESQFGNGPQDIVLPFGGRHTTGHFRFSSMWKIASGTGAYFNFQGGASTGSSWALDFYLWDYGGWDAGNLSGNYPQDQWFEIAIDIDLDQGLWEIFIDGQSAGTWYNGTNAVSYLDIFPLFSDTKFWVDDVSYCKDAGCLPDVSVDNVSISPQPLCSNHFGDISVTLTNNSKEDAKSITLGFQTNNDKVISKTIGLDNLAFGEDTTVVIKNVYKTNLSGNNLPFSVFSVLGDRNTSNDTFETSINVRRSPNGFDLSKGSTFQGVEGQNLKPDLIEVGKTNSYVLSPPSGFSNSDFPGFWTISNVSATTENGVSVPNTFYTYNPPNGSNGATISFTGHNNYLDSVLTFYVTVKGQASGCDSIATRKVRIVPTPKTNFTFSTPVCKGDDVLFSNTTTIHSGNFTCHWYFGDGDSSDVIEAVHAYQQSGTFNVRLVATSFPYGIVKDTTIKVTVNEIPVAKFKVNNKCAGTALEFTNQSSIASGTITYVWNFGDNSPNSTATNPTHLYANAGAAKVTLTAQSNGCSSTFTRNALTFNRPVAAFTAPTGSVCANSQSLFKNNSTIAYGNMGNLWNFGDGTTATSTDAQHKFANSGTYNVKLVAVSEFDCRDSITKQVTVIKAPNPDFSASLYCSKSPTQFINTTVEDLPNPVYTWNFSDGISSALKNVTRTWPSPGPKSATLKAKFSNGCEASVTKNFTVLLQPNAQFDVNDICNSETAIFVNKSSGDEANISYSWSFGDGGSSLIQNPTHVYPIANTTNYTAVLVASYSNGCNDTFRKSVTVSETPVCDFTYKGLGFRKTQFTPSNTTYTSYQWMFGEGGSSEDKTPVYDYRYSGNFKVTMRAVNAGGCECEITKVVSANLGLNDQTLAYGVNIYPNPSNGIFNISNSKDKAMTIEIFNMIGEKVTGIESLTPSAQIDLGNTASGVYMVKVTIDGVSQTYKITVSN